MIFLERNYSVLYWFHLPPFPAQVWILPRHTGSASTLLIWCLGCRAFCGGVLEMLCSIAKLLLLYLWNSTFLLVSTKMSPGPDKHPLGSCSDRAITLLLSKINWRNDRQSRESKLCKASWVKPGHLHFRVALNNHWPCWSLLLPRFLWIKWWSIEFV